MLKKGQNKSCLTHIIKQVRISHLKHHIYVTSHLYTSHLKHSQMFPSFHHPNHPCLPCLPCLPWQFRHLIPWILHGSDPAMVPSGPLRSPLCGRRGERPHGEERQPRGGHPEEQRCGRGTGARSATCLVKAESHDSGEEWFIIEGYSGLIVDKWCLIVVNSGE